jgi:hypothetical protein
MWLIYLIAFIPVLIGAILWVKSRRIVWWEWGLSSLIGFIIALSFHAIVISSMTADVETWSGKIIKVEHEPRWIEEYQVAIYRTETYTYYSNGTMHTGTRQVFSHFETRHRNHGPNWTTYANFGKHDEVYSISESKYNYLKQKFGKESSCLGSRPGFDGGDRNNYYLINNNKWIEPVTCTMSFENRVKACPSVFSFVKVPENTKGLFEWPQTKDSFSSNRLLGLAQNHFNTLLFDQMNTRLGPTSKVNVIIIGWNSRLFDSFIAQYQEAKWIGGKKNDLVLCYGYSNGKVDWSYVFGWTEKAIVKRNLETLLLNNPMNDQLLSQIEQEIITNYKLKNWDKFNYLTVEPPGWSYIVLIIIMIVIQGIIWICFMNNNSEKGLE